MKMQALFVLHHAGRLLNIWHLQLDVRGFFHSIHRPTLLHGWLAFLDGLELSPKRKELAAYISTALMERSPADNHHAVRSSLPLLREVPRNLGT